MTEPQASKVLATRAADGRPIIGHVLLARGADENGDPAIAVWQVSTEGVPTGAWITPEADIAERAADLLSVCAGRALSGWDVEPGRKILAELAGAAGVPVPDPPEITLREAITEVIEVRAECDRRVEAHREATKSTARLEWEVDLPARVDSESALRVVARLGWQADAAPVAKEILMTAGLLAWCARAWRETVGAVRRRSYLSEVTAPSVLPPRWEDAVARAV